MYTKAVATSGGSLVVLNAPDASSLKVSISSSGYVMRRLYTRERCHVSAEAKQIGGSLSICVSELIGVKLGPTRKEGSMTSQLSLPGFTTNPKG